MFQEEQLLNEHHEDNVIQDPPGATEAPAVQETYEDTRAIIRNLVEGLKPRAAGDLDVVVKTAGILEGMVVQRNALVQKLADESKQLNTTLKRLEQDHARQQTRFKGLGYQQKMAELQKEKVDIAKELSELEMSTNWASGDLSNLRAELATLEAKNIAQELVVGPEIIHLGLLRDAGFHSTATGDWIINSSEDVHILPAGAAKSPNDVWHLASEPLSRETDEA